MSGNASAPTRMFTGDLADFADVVDACAYDGDDEVKRELPVFWNDAAPDTSAYRAFQERSGCRLVFYKLTQRYVMVLPGAELKPKGFTLGSKLYRKRNTNGVCLSVRL